MNSLPDEIKRADPLAQFHYIEPRLKGMLWSHYGSQPDGEDLVAVGLTGAWEALSSQEGKWSPWTLAYRGAKWAVIDWQRKKNSQRLDLTDNRGTPGPSEIRPQVVKFSELLRLDEYVASDIDELDEGLALLSADLQEPDFSKGLLDRLEARAIAREVLSRCTPTQRHYLILHYWKGWTQAAIAAHYGVTLSAVQCGISWALNKYRRSVGLAERGMGLVTIRTRKERRTGKTKEHCARGHPWTTESRWINKEGCWICRTCRNENVKARDRRKKCQGPTAVTLPPTPASG